jgi:hypothetical protein
MENCNIAEKEFPALITDAGFPAGKVVVVPT